MCQICKNNYTPSIELIIEDCQEIVKIPDIEGLRFLTIINCSNIKEIHNIKGLHLLSVKHCHNIKKIPNITGLQVLTIVNCQNFKKIPRIAITGLNPHCESNFKNCEEDSIITPAIKNLKAKNFKKLWSNF